MYFDFTELSATVIKLYDFVRVFHTKPSIALLVLSPSSLPATCLTYNVLRGSIRTGAHDK